MFFQRLIVKLINILLKFLKKETQTKLLNEHNPIYEPSYRDNAVVVKEVYETPSKRSTSMEYIVSMDAEHCAICGSYSTIKKHCRPDRRLKLIHLKKFWHKTPICNENSIHYHCSCEDCGCRWLVFLNVKTKKIEII